MDMQENEMVEQPLEGVAAELHNDSVADDAILAELRGNLISGEVSGPPKKNGRKAEAEPQETADEAPEEGDEEYDEYQGADELHVSERLDLERLRGFKEKASTKLTSMNEELQELRAMNEQLTAKAGLSMSSLYDPKVISALSQEERAELAAFVFYAGKDDAPPEVKGALDKMTRKAEEARYRATLAEREAESRAEHQRMVAESRLNTYQTQVSEELLENADNYEHTSALFAGNRRAIARAVFDEAAAMAIEAEEAGEELTAADITPAKVLASIEERAARIMANNSRGVRPSSNRKEASSVSQRRNVDVMSDSADDTILAMLEED
ncbi:MAG: hypothetical protein IPL79_20165 [Myxococcales bacterium]|nr:hypothetical protein [Myxococcales bacterium]